MQTPPLFVRVSLLEPVAHIGHDNWRCFAEISAITLVAFAGLLCLLPFPGDLPPVAFWETTYWFPAIAGLVLFYGFVAAMAQQQFRRDDAPSIASL